MNLLKANKKYLFLFFCFLQLLVPFFIIYHYYNTLNTGERYKVSVQKYDPYDPFRGRYVAISPQLNLENTSYNNIMQVTKGKDGFAIFHALSSKPKNKNYVKNLILNRYYMNEHLAPKADELINRDFNEQSEFYIILAVKNGHYTIEGMYYQDEPIEKYLTK